MLTYIVILTDVAQMQVTVSDLVIQPLNVLRLYSILAVHQLRKKLYKMHGKLVYLRWPWWSEFSKNNEWLDMYILYVNEDDSRQILANSCHDYKNFREPLFITNFYQISSTILWYEDGVEKKVKLCVFLVKIYIFCDLMIQPAQPKPTVIMFYFMLNCYKII